MIFTSTEAHAQNRSLQAGDPFSFIRNQCRTNPRRTPRGVVRYSLSKESAALVRRQSCLKSGTRLRVVGRITGRGRNFSNLQMTVSPLNFRDSGQRFSRTPEIGPDGRFSYKFITPRHVGPTGNPGPQGVSVQVTDSELAFRVPGPRFFPGTDNVGVCPMRSIAGPGTRFRACIER
jgi:hypothetical protein